MKESSDGSEKGKEKGKRGGENERMGERRRGRGASFIQPRKGEGGNEGRGVAIV